ncbi:hypothetical protein QQS21_006294 [Conoideocrella luteorostrata]|uniref:Zn(2)-C6 fungal-type domain-containing protein n=1 Tax=Conoideocrella luteorostrata TaxID=1105319 RepID=A0AAJ0CQT7_9HYPO|nr:hypothetical protein QQS21_006294 [Conoideocrella luteorostrata]
MASLGATSLVPRRQVSKVRQACDSCRTRKIRCDGAHPCLNCRDISCDCTYLAIPKKTGPKGRRLARPDHVRKATHFSTTLPSTVRASAASSQPQSQPPSQSQPAPCHDASSVVPQEIPSPTLDDALPLIGDGGFWLSPSVTKEVLTSCLDAFFTHKYPITPILDRDYVYGALANLQNSPEMYGLITACCAVMVLSPDIIVTDDSGATSARPLIGWKNEIVNAERPSIETPTAEFLISETVRARSFCDFTEHPSLATVQTSFFLFAAFFCLGKDNSAWHYIREAITTLQSLRLHEEATYSDITDTSMALYARRMFWVLFITERAYALQRHRPLTLQSGIALPSLGHNSEEGILSGLLDLISLFRNFDTEFINMWNVSNDPPLSAPQDYPARLQQFLESALPCVSERNANQQADLLLSREWLKIVVWQLCVSKTLLRSSSPVESMSLRFPVSVARNVVVTTSLLPNAALEANGVGILEKIFDVGCSLADVLSLNPSCVPRTALEIGPGDYLREMIRLVGTAAGGSPRHLRVLAAKAEECLRSNTPFIMTPEQHISGRSDASVLLLDGDLDDDDWSTDSTSETGDQCTRT